MASAVRAAEPCGAPPRVTLDIGHSPRAPGATSARGRSEYRFNRRLAVELGAVLRAAGITDVVILNEAGRELSLGARAGRIAALRRGVMISIHHDSVQPRYLRTWVHEGRKRRYSDRFRGHSLFIAGRSPSSESSKRLALAIGGHMRVAGFVPSLHHAEKIRGENRPLLDRDVGLYRFDGLAILRRARVPSVLVEAGVIVHRQEERDLDSRAYRARLARAIAEGVRSFCTGS